MALWIASLQIRILLFHLHLHLTLAHIDPSSCRTGLESNPAPRCVPYHHLALFGFRSRSSVQLQVSGPRRSACPEPSFEASTFPVWSISTALSLLTDSFLACLSVYGDSLQYKDYHPKSQVAVHRLQSGVSDRILTPFSPTLCVEGE